MWLNDIHLKEIQIAIIWPKWPKWRPMTAKFCSTACETFILCPLGIVEEERKFIGDSWIVEETSTYIYFRIYCPGNKKFAK